MLDISWVLNDGVLVLIGTVMGTLITMAFNYRIARHKDETEKDVRRHTEDTSALLEERKLLDQERTKIMAEWHSAHIKHAEKIQALQEEVNHWRDLYLQLRDEYTLLKASYAIIEARVASLETEKGLVRGVTRINGEKGK